MEDSSRLGQIHSSSFSKRVCARVCVCGCACVVCVWCVYMSVVCVVYMGGWVAFECVCVCVVHVCTCQCLSVCLYVAVRACVRAYVRFLSLYPSNDPFGFSCDVIN